MQKIFYFILFSLSAIIPSLSQQINFKEYKKKYPDSDYVILEKKSELKYYVEPTTNKLKAKLFYTETILVLTEKTDIVDLVQVPFSDFQEVTITSAKYFKIDSLNKKVLIENIKTKYTESKNYYVENIFYSDLKVKQFACSQPIGERTLLTYSYEKTYHDLKFIDKIELQEANCNTELFELTVKAPKANSIDFAIYPVNLTYNDYSIQESVVGEELVNKIRITNLKSKAVHTLPPSENYYLPHFLILTKSYKISDRKYIVLESVDDLYKWYSSLIKELPPVAPEIIALATTITASAKTPEENIEAIFQWTQKNINYIAFEDGIAGFKPETSLLVYQSRYGDCKGMANLLVDLLRAKGFEAYHTWIGTRHLNYTYTIPTLYIDNHMICALFYNNTYYFLDATSKTTPWTVPPDHIQGKQALVGMGDNYKIVNVPVSDAAKNTVNITADINLSQPGKPIINGNITFAGELVDNIKAMEIYYSKANQKIIPDILISRNLSFVFNPLASISKNTKNEYAINFKSNSLNNLCLGSNQLLLLSDIDRSYYGTSTDTSLIPVNIENPSTISSIVKYTLPLNSKIVTIPEEIAFTSSDNVFSFKAKYSVVNNILTYQKDIKINSLLIKNTKDWNDFISLVEKSYDQLLTIKLN